MLRDALDLDPILEAEEFAAVGEELFAAIELIEDEHERHVAAGIVLRAMKDWRREHRGRRNA